MITNLRVLAILFVVLVFADKASGQTKPLSEQMAATVMDIWKDSLEMQPGKSVKWAYDQGVVLEGIEGIWKRTGNGAYFEYIQKSMDFFVNNDGSIRTYKQNDYNIDNVKNGRSLLLLYKVTKQEKYKKAAGLLREQLKGHPRTNEGGFWHKKIYPYQMWLDGLYMGEPFYTEYAATFNESTAFDDIANQFIYMENHARDAKTGLLYHGWDESKQQKWANQKTGLSPHFWGRAMGWYAMALVDVLDNFPAKHPKRASLTAILKRLADATQKYQDPKSGLWYQVLDKPTGKGNYLEASASCMFVYSIAKAVRLEYLPKTYLKIAQKGYDGIKKEFVEQAGGGKVNLKGTVSVAGLGGNPYRDGSYEYYLSEKVITNDPKGVGAFLLASNEMEIAALPKLGLGKKVILDYYFNNETKKDDNGQLSNWHYTWGENSHGGFSLFGDIFKSAGFKTAELKEAPNTANLKQANVYIIVDPDTEKENPKPNYIKQKHIQSIKSWVKAGGVLVLMANDTGNVELDHFNQLAKAFGVQFKKNSINRVKNNNFEEGKILVSASNSIFKAPKKLYLKEVSTLAIQSPAKAVLESNGEIIMATSKLGKGTVFVVGDPWIYNEYVDGRKLPAEYENFAAANDLVKWVAEQIPGK
jgi:unsaturated rhamnogalacturonyl hydrolase